MDARLRTVLVQSTAVGQGLRWGHSGESGLVAAVAVYMVAHPQRGWGSCLGQGRVVTALQIDACSQHPRAGGGGDTRAELADPAATSPGNSALEAWCFVSLQVTLVQRTEPAGRGGRCGYSKRAESTLEGAGDLGDCREQQWDTLSP